jgi:hypothetical protein
MARAAALLQGFEIGTVRLAGFLPDFEQAAVTWQAGQHCPDALAALTVPHDVLTYAAARRCAIIAPLLGVRLGRPDPSSPGRPAVIPIEEALRLRRRLGAIPGLGHSTRQPQRWAVPGNRPQILSTPRAMSCR